MNNHENARLTHHGRAELVHRVLVKGQMVSQVAAPFGVCVKTVRKWVARFEAEGRRGCATGLRAHTGFIAQPRTTSPPADPMLGFLQ